MDNGTKIISLFYFITTNEKWWIILCRNHQLISFLVCYMEMTMGRDLPWCICFATKTSIHSIREKYSLVPMTSAPVEVFKSSFCTATPKYHYTTEVTSHVITNRITFIHMCEKYLQILKRINYFYFPRYKLGFWPIFQFRPTFHTRALPSSTQERWREFKTWSTAFADANYFSNFTLSFFLVWRVFEESP